MNGWRRKPGGDDSDGGGWSDIGSDGGSWCRIERESGRENGWEEEGEVAIESGENVFVLDIGVRF